MSWVRKYLTAEVTGRWEEGEPQKDTTDWRTLVKFSFKNLAKIMASENNASFVLIYKVAFFFSRD